MKSCTVKAEGITQKELQRGYGQERCTYYTCKTNNWTVDHKGSPQGNFWNVT